MVEVVMPKAGMTMVEGTIMEWIAAEGAEIKKGDALFEFENEKNTIQCEALGGGILHITANVGDTIGIGERCGFLAESKEEYEKICKEAPEAAPAAVEAPAEAAAPATPAAPAAPAAPAPAPVAPAAPVASAAVVNGRVRASGLARKMAKEAGIDLAAVPAPNGRIQAKDVEAFLANPVAAAPVAAPVCGRDVEDVITTTPWIGVKKTIANNMLTSITTTAQSTCMLEVDVTDLLALRQKLVDNAEALGFKCSVNDLLCKMLGKILVKHPLANATFDGTNLYSHSHVHLAVAVATDGGLMCPVVKNIDVLSLKEIHDQIATYAKQAKDKCLPMDAQQGATTMVTNFGVFPMDFSTPILNAPQTCILGFGRTVLKPAVLPDGTIGPRSMMYVTFTLDHQVIDGLEVGNIFGEIEQYMKNPEMILV